jgi:hypothetical protein
MHSLVSKTKHAGGATDFSTVFYLMYFMQRMHKKKTGQLLFILDKEKSLLYYSNIVQPAQLGLAVRKLIILCFDLTPPSAPLLIYIFEILELQSIARKGSWYIDEEEPAHA